MTPADLLRELRSRGVILAARGDRLLVEAPKGVLTPQLKARLTSHKAELLHLLSPPDQPATLDIESSRVAAVKFVNTAIGDVWLFADGDALGEHPDIVRSGLPVFYFDEVPYLAGKTAAELKAIGRVKAAFPRGRVLQ